MTDARGTPYLLELTIENCRCFGRKQTVDLSDGAGEPARWTVILGDNGTGKTTLLQAIAGLEPVRREPDRVAPRAPCLAPVAAGALEKGSYRVSGRWSWGTRHTKGSGEQEEVQYQGFRGASSVWLGGYSVSKFRWGGQAAWAGYGALRRMGDASYIEDPPPPTSTLFDDAVELANAEEWLLQADHVARRAKGAERKRLESRRDQVIAMLIELLPDVTDIRYQDQNDKPPRVELASPYGWVRMDQLGLGYRTMIAWTVDLAHRLHQLYPDSPDPLAERAVVLVDEIDLHLHPKWQRELMSYLGDRFPRAQFIVTAHSPLVAVSAPGDANLVVLRREGGAVTIDNDVRSVRNWRVDQVLTSDLFDLESVWSPELTALIDERRELLSKSRLTKADRQRIEALEREIGEMPVGERLDDIEAMQILRRAAAELKS